MNIEKAKESLKRIKTSHYTAMTWLGVDKPDVETQEAIKVVENTITESEEIQKAMEIIVKNLIDIHDIVVYSTFSAFNQHRTLRGLTTITQAEFDLVTKVVKKYEKI